MVASQQLWTLQSCHWGVWYGPTFAPPVPGCLSRELSHIIIADILTAALLGLFCSTNRTYVFFIYALPLKLPFTTQNYILRYLVLGPYPGS